MSAIEKVVWAYARRHDISPSQANFVRDALAQIIDEMMTIPRQGSTHSQEATRESDCRIPEH